MVGQNWLDLGPKINIIKENHCMYFVNAVNSLSKTGHENKLFQKLKLSKNDFHKKFSHKPSFFIDFESQIFNLFVTSKKRNHEFTNLNTAKRPAILLKPLYNGVLFLIHYFKKHFKPCLFILKAFKDILQHFKFVNW